MPRPRKQERRAHGEGSIYKRKNKAGKVIGYRGEIFLGYDAQGAPLRWRCSAKTQEEVVAALAKARAEQLGGKVLVGPKQTLGEYLDWWLADVAPQTAREHTMVDYRSIAARHLKPALGAVPLAKLAPPQITHLLASKRQDGLSPRRVQYIRAVLHKAYADAVRHLIVDRNPVDAVPAPKVETPERQPLDLEQLQTFLNAVVGDPLEALYVLAVSTGMRQGELLALRRRDYDRPKRTLHVRRSLAWIDGKPVFAEPKSRSSRRAVLLTLFALGVLDRHLARQAAAGLAMDPEALVFCGPGGAPLNGVNVTRHQFYPLLQRAGLPRVRFHDIRHSLASLLIDDDTHPKQVQGLFGHSTIQMTLDLYSHLSTRLQRELVERIEGRLFGGRLPPIPPQSAVKPAEVYGDENEVGSEDEE